MNIIFRWSTGSIEVPAENISNFSAAKIKQLIKVAEVNREEVKAEIADYLNGMISALDQETEIGKREASKLEDLLAAAMGKRQTAQEKAIRRIIKNCARYDLAGAFRGAGKQCFTDGYRVIRLSAPLDGFPAASGKLDTDAIISAEKYTVNLKLPTVKELKQAIALAKKGVESGRVRIANRGAYWYDFGDVLPLVDAKFLLDMLDALPGCTASFVAGKPSDPIYFSADCGDGILLPCRRETAEDAARQAVAKADLEAERAREEAEREAARRAEKEAEEEKRAARIAPLEGYLDTLPPAKAARAEKYLLDKLIRYNGIVLPICDYIKTLIAEGHVPEMQENVLHCRRGGKTTVIPIEYVMRIPSENRYYEIKKTEYNFATFLLEKHQTEPIPDAESQQEGASAVADEPEITASTTPQEAHQRENEVPALNLQDQAAPHADEHPEDSDAPIAVVSGVSISLPDFRKSFYSAYEVLYEYDENGTISDGYTYDDFSRALENGESIIEKYRNFVISFCRYIQDFIASDREISAFWLAFRSAVLPAIKAGESAKITAQHDGGAKPGTAQTPQASPQADSDAPADQASESGRPLPPIPADRPAQSPARNFLRRSLRSFSAAHASAGFAPMRSDRAPRSRAVSMALATNPASVLPVTSATVFIASASSRGRSGRSGRSPPLDFVV